MARFTLRFVLALALLFSILAVGCAGAPATEVQPEVIPTETEVIESEEEEKPTSEPVIEVPVEITIVVGAEPRSLHPHAITDAASEAIMLNMYEPLVYLSSEGVVSPLLAESWEIIDDVTYKFTLRDGVVFHDGTALTVDGVVASLNELINPADEQPYGSGIFTTNIEEVKRVDDQSFTIKTSVPFGPLMRNLTQIRITPPDMSRDELSMTVNGTGPYKLVEYVEGSHLVLERFEDYWGPEPQVDKVTFRVVPEASARVAEIQAGQADLVANIPPELVRVVAGVPGVKLIIAPTTYRITMTYNLEVDSPIRVPEVRQAINYATDRESIINNILAGYGELVGPLLPQDLGYNPDFVDFNYDPEKAKALLESAGYSEGFDLVIATPQGRYAKDKEISEAFAGMLREIGINARVQVYEWGSLLDKLVNGTIDPIYLIGWRGVNFDASAALTAWNCESPYSNYCNEEVQAFFEQGQSLVTTEDRTAAYQNALAIYLTDPGVNYIFQETAIYAAGDNITWTPRVDQLIFVKTITVEE